MVKVFLVEDEMVIRNGIKNKIQWEKEGLRFVGEAGDGELAYPKILKEEPDILITDIKMPFMDGLELSRIVKQELPGIKIIILSGYNDFDYAKKAISIGVTEYLLKPIDAEKLLEVIKKVQKQVEQGKEQSSMLEMYQKEMMENIRLQKHNLWISLVSGQMSVAELLDAGKRLQIDFTAACYQVVLLKLMEEEGPDNHTRESVAFADDIMMLTEQWEDILSFDRSPDGWAFLLKGDSEEILKQEQISLKNTIQELVGKYEGVEYFGGIGNVVHRMSDIRLSYQSAAKAFASRYFLESNQLFDSQSMISIQGTESEKIDISNVKSKKEQHERVERFLKSGSIEEVDDFVESFFQAIGEKNYQSLIFRQYIVLDLYFIVADFLQQIDIAIEDLSEEYRDINLMAAQVSSGEYLIHLISGLFREVLLNRDNKSMKRYSTLLEEAKEFIRENYQSENMSLNMVASRINMSPGYFSTIFSGEMGQTFVEYLTEVRLEKAKELLMCTTMRTAEIAFEVGYRDSHYFSYIFKKVVGCSPKEFRSRGKE